MTPSLHTPIDRAIIEFDTLLRTLAGRPRVTERMNPAAGLEETALDDRQRDHHGRLMRINHTGEVCAQGLYQGQALTAQLPQVREQMARAAQEENDHLDWCESRIQELGGRKSLLNPLWYLGSLAMGAAAGAIGDKWSLGFVVETERQVETHLQEHLDDVTGDDIRTRAILEQMQEDETRHAEKALEAGGAPLPEPVRAVMRLMSKVMTKTVYWV